MSKIIIVSNRLPVKLDIQKEQVTQTESSGGLATGMKSIHNKNDSVWIGWSGLAADQLAKKQQKEQVFQNLTQKRYVPVSLTTREIDEYYYGFSNRTLWPLFHYFLCYAKYNNKTWNTYKRVNKKFANKVLAYAEEDDTVWIHDYQLMLVPQLLREQRPKLKIGFFLHIPFPTYEVFRVLPFRKEILQGILGADVIGFHTLDYKQCFLKSVASLLKNMVNGDTVEAKNRCISVKYYPMGIDAKRFEKAAKERQEQKETTDIQEELNKYKKRNPKIKLVLSIDRLDYSKGIINRIRAFSYFLKKHPEYKGKICLLMLAVPSRTDVLRYQLLKKEVDELVGRVNGKFATIGWTPIWYYFRSLPFENLLDLYTTCDIALITPLRDGMNLVAKEYISARHNKNGVLILSEMTGAAKELDKALLINPNSFDEISNALLTAIKMPDKEQKQRNKIMQEHLRKNNVFKWAENFLKDVENSRKIETIKMPQEINNSIEEEIIYRYQNASNRLLFLDYDGSLVGFKDDPQAASPDKELLELLNQLGSTVKNDVFIISGRKKNNLENWFCDLRISLIAEHGLSIRNDRVNWEETPIYHTNWMQEVKEVLENFTQNTPGSFIEEKKRALAWHYRKAPKGHKKAQELITILKNIAENNEIDVLSGNKVIEVVSNQVNKGNAVCAHLEKFPADFILAIGDDVTDESMFKKLPPHAVSIKVGKAVSAARYTVKNYKEVRRLLERLVKSKKSSIKLGLKEKRPSTAKANKTQLFNNNTNNLIAKAN